MKELQYISEVVNLSYDNLCIHPNLDLLEGFKVPKFEIFLGIGNPLAHLRSYCNKLVGIVEMSFIDATLLPKSE